MTELKILEERLDQHRAEVAAYREADQYERREMKTIFNNLSENMIHLTSAVTEWKTRDAMFDKAQQKQETKIEDLTEKQHSLELRVVSLEGTAHSNTKAKDIMVAFWLKITGAIFLLAVIGGLTYKLGGL